MPNWNLDANIWSKGWKIISVYGATLEDIDLDFVTEYIHKIGYAKTAVEYLKQNKNFVIAGDKISTAAILLFGKNPQRFFPGPVFALSALTELKRKLEEI